MEVMKFIILIVPLLTRATVDAATTVTSLSYHFGSSNGQTAITISGSEFADDSFNGLGADQNLGNSVYLESDTKEYECDVDKDATDENTITCYTRPMDEGTYYVKLQVNGLDIPESSYCSGNRRSYQCSFTVVWWRTPLVNSVSPQSGLPGEILNVAGRLYTDKFRSSDSTASNGVTTASVRRVWFTGGQACQLLREMDTPYGISLDYDADADTYSNWGDFDCLLSGNFVSSLNASFIVDEDFGRSKPQASAFRVSADNRLYMYQSYAGISSVSPSTGSLNGGTELSISGSYLNDPSIQITVGGVDCTVVTRTDGLVTCTTPTSSDVQFQDSYPGSRGIAVEVYEGLDDATSIDGVSYEDYAGSKSKFTSDDASVNYLASVSPVVVRFSGFFVPAVDGHYRLGATKAGTTIYLSTDNTAASKALVTGEVSLSAGQYYYYEVVHTESSSQVDFNVNAYLKETSYNYNQTSMARPDRQNITSSSPDEHEIQTVTLADWDLVSAPVQEVLSLCVTCKAGQNCTGSEEYYFTMHGIDTVTVLSSGPAATVKKWIENLPTMHGEQVTVVKDSEPGACFSSYTITVESTRGSLPLQVQSASTQLIDVDLTITTPSVASRSTFALMYNGIPSAPATVGDAASVASAAKTLFAPMCPKNLEQPGNAWLSLDFESVSDRLGESSGEMTGEDSYCGTKSLKNPSTLVINPYYPNQIIEGSKFCIAYKGANTFTVGIEYLFTDNTDNSESEGQFQYSYQGNNNWKHVCKDVYSSLSSVNGFNVRLANITLNADASDDDFFLDNIFIGQIYLLDTELSALRGMRKLPQTNIKLEEVEVAVSGADYAITMKAYDCATGIGLLQGRQGSEFGSAAITVVRTQAAAPEIGGTFTVTLPTTSAAYGGTSSAIPWNVEEPELEQYLEALPGLSDVTVKRSGTCRGYSWQVTFENPAGNHESLSVIPSFTNAAAAIETVTTIEGGLYLNPIPGDWLRVAHSSPQVEISINNVPSLCTDDQCSYAFDTASTPTVSNVALASPTLTIAGTGFSTTASDNTVQVGGADCAVQSSTAIEIQCTLSEAPSGTQNVVVNVRGSGLSNEFSVDVPIIVSSVSPEAGSTNGGTRVVITGSGFSASTTVGLGASASCEVTDVSYNSISCVTTADAAGEVDVTVGDAVASDASQKFTFEASTASGSISPTTMSVAGGELTITGTGLGTASDDNAVYVNGVEATISAWTDTSITVTAPSLPPSTYTVDVYVHPTGYVDMSAGDSVEYIFSVTGVSATASSLMGGRELTISGSGFDGDVEVSLGDLPCSEVTKSATSITCMTGSASAVHQVQNTGTGVDGEGYAWSTTALNVNTGDKVVWAWSQIAGVSGAAYQVFSTASATASVYDGNGFNSGTPTSEGAFEYQFNQAGTYHYGGLGNAASNTFMRGVIVVTDAADASLPVVVTSSGHQATVPAGGLTVTYSQDSTPVIASVSPSSGTTDQVITISGTGFSNTLAENHVTVGDAACVLETATETALECKVDGSAEPVVGTYLEVKVRVDGKGYSMSQIRSNDQRYHAVLPHISAISPSVGSLIGGTSITIAGGGFTNVASVKIGGVDCSVTSSGYGSVACVTGALLAGSYDVDVTMNNNGVNLDAVCIAASCEFEYATSATITLQSITPDAVSGQTEFTIAWNGLASDTVEVKLGTVVCTSTEVTDAHVKCSVDGMPAGTYDVTMNIDGKGYADSSLTVSSAAVLDSVSPSAGSVNGFTTVTINGNGFDPDTAAVTLGALTCEVQSATTNTIVCVTSPSSQAETVNVSVASFGASEMLHFAYETGITPEVTAINPSEGSPGDTITLTVTVGAHTQEPTIEFGGVACVGAQSSGNTVDCTLGSRYGGAAEISVVYTELGKANVAAGVAFGYRFDVTQSSPASGSLGGYQEVTITGFGFTESTTVTVCGVNAPTVNYQSSSSITILTPTNAAGACQVSVSNVGQSVDSPDTFTYDASLTPEVTSVSPTTGGTGGGTVLTITGTQLSLVDQVTIAGSECVTSSVTDTEIVCTTSSHTGSINAQVTCTTASGGIAAGNAEFYYVDRWSSLFTWGGESLPQDGEFIIIQEGQTILLDTETNVLKMLLIQGGQVIFENSGSVHLQAENILITSGGLLQIGTEEEEYTAEAMITMWGNLRSTELPIYGAKTLGVRDGRLEMHGRHIQDTWALLDSTAVAGSNQITLSMPVSWSAGNKIVIASTGHRHSQIENEERTIDTITVTGAGKTVITLTEALEYEHLGVTETYTDSSGNSHSFDYRGEVGLLSRNIIFRGSEEITWSETVERCPEGFDTGMFVTQTCFQGRFGEEAGSDEFGASIMIHSRAPNTDPNNAVAQARIEYVELNYVGQAFRLGRYPIHWHLMGDMTGNYVRGCAIHRTFNRAVTIHNTHNLLVERNVIYNIMGGAFFIEDGIETGNVIQYNLAVFVKQSTSLLNDDITPAAYWVTNPNNTIQHNHAAGGTHFGFWYRMHEHPDGPSFDPNICQQNVELGTFQNNTAHTQGWFGLWIFQKYLPREGSGCGAVAPSAAKFYTLTSWHCEKGSEWVEGGAIQFIGFKSASHEDSAIDVKLIFGTEWSKEDRGSMIQDNLVVGRANFETAADEGRYGIVLPFAPGLWLDGITFVNFAESENTAFIVTHISGTCTVLCGGFTYRMERLSFTNVNTRITWRWEHEGVIEDLDGTFTGDMTPQKVVPSSEIYYDGTSCQVMTDQAFSRSDAYPSMKCSPDVHFHRLAFNDISPESLRYKNATFTRVDAPERVAKSLFAKKRLTHAEGSMFLLRGGKEYIMGFENGGSFINMTYNAKFYDLFEGDYVIVKHEMHQAPSRIAVCGDDGDSCDPITVPASGEGTAIDSTSDNKAWHYDDVNGLFTYMVTRRTSSRKKRGSMSWQQMDGSELSNYVVRMTIERCLYEDCIVPTASGGLADVFAVDDSAVSVNSFDDTSSCFVVEGDGTDRVVTIPSDCWILWNISSGSVKRLNVDGNLVFSDTQDISLTATYIVVKGRFIAGYSVWDPRTHKLEITLEGTPTTEELVASSGAVIGSKALACHGTCDLHGRDTAKTWTRLGATASVGSNQIVLGEAVSWTAGDEIVIAPSGFNAWRTEKNTISSISADGLSITLASNLQYEHKHEKATYGSRPEVDLSAEVGLLTRSIRIIGAENSDSYGARVLVTSTETQYTAKGRFSNVEFYRTGQEGYYDDFDPRNSLAIKTAGPDASQVRKCSFHDGYAPAVGVYGTDKVRVSDNVIHHTVHEAVVIKGFGHQLTDNLVVLNVFSGSYNGRFESANFDYTAAVNVETATQLTMTGNAVAGAERVAYRISGQPCDTTGEMLWSGNVAHATLLGTGQMKTALQGCNLVNGFTIYNAWDFAIYHQTTDSVRVENCTVVDSTVGYMPLVAGPDPLTHEFADKSATVKNCLFVGRRDLSQCADDMDEETDRSLIIRRVAGVNKKAYPNTAGGRSGVMLPLFEGGYNGATFKALHVNMNYPAIYGLLSFEDVTFANFKSTCNVRDVMFYTNPINEDISHPTHLSGITKVNSDEDSTALIDRPSVGLINPSDCVDMQCDGMIKILINDLDGSFLGSSGSIISQSEHKWGDQTLGLGDYRIPKPMLTATDGTRIPVEDVVPTKGIARKGGSCVLNDNWQAYKCTGDTYRYKMLVIESLDADTETRRLSPIAIRVGDTVDLVNGPQDHGWCSGYTCQKRISTFYTIVPLGERVEIYFTSTPPLNFKLHLLNSAADEKLAVAIWIPNPQLLEVYSNDALVDANNKNGFKLEKPPANDPDRFKPSPTTTSAGENYLDLDTRLLHIGVTGAGPLEIQTKPAIIVNMMFPAISIDDFFETNLISNLASLLEIDSSKIRRVNVVAETSRRRRSTSLEEVSFEIEQSTQAELQTVRTKLVTAVQSGGVSSNGVVAADVTTSGTLSEEDIATIDTALRSGEDVTSRNAVRVPSKIRVTMTNPAGQELSTVSAPPLVELLDDTDIVVEESADYQVAVTLDVSHANADSRAVISGTTTLTFTRGVANFTDITISHSGSYNLVITPSGGNGVATAETVVIVIEDRSVCADVARNGALVTEGDSLQFTAQLTDCAGANLQDVAHKGYTYKLDISFDDASLYVPATLTGTTTFDFDANGALTASGPALGTTTAYHRYNLNFRLYTDPASSYDTSVAVHEIQIYPSDQADYIHEDNSNQRNLILTFSENYDYVVDGTHTLEMAQSALYNSMLTQYPHLYFTQFQAGANSAGKLQITTSVTAANLSSITGFYKEFDAQGQLSFSSKSVSSSSSCAIQISNSCYQSGGQAASGSDEADVKAIVFGVLGACIALAIAIVAATYLVKRHNASKVSAMRCMGGSPDSTRALHRADNELSWSRTSTPEHDEYRMTPVAAN